MIRPEKKGGVLRVTEFGAERERLATLMDFLIEIDEVRAKGKTSLSLDEIEALVLAHAKKVRNHK